ncbi:MAG: hypothetical protein ACI4IV_01425 [Acutalibacteraceae bacterium]
MIFAKREPRAVKSLVIDGLTEGIDGAAGQCVRGNKPLTDAENMWCDGNLIKTRDGFTSVVSGGIHPGIGHDIDYSYVGDMVKKDDRGIKMYLVKVKDGQKVILKLLTFASEMRTECIHIFTYNPANYSDSESVSCLIFNDQSCIGCGIFALIGVKGTNGKLVDKRILELSGSMTEFLSVPLSKVYSPIIYINSKGQNYAQLDKKEQKFADRRRAEDINLLSGGYTVAFTTDGVSSMFSMPIYPLSNLAGRDVEISYTNDLNYTQKFVIKSGNMVSDTVNIQGTAVCVYLYRNTGIVQFRAGNNVYIPAKAEMNTNNLLIRAYADNVDERLYSMTRFENFGPHTFLYGSKEEPNMLCWSYGGDKPLYFPQSSFRPIGAGFQSITATAKQNNLMIIFKSHEIYYISAVNTKNYSTQELLQTNGTPSGLRQSVNVAQLNAGTGCNNPATIKLCGNRLVFLGSDGDIYALTSTAMSQKQVYKISRQVEKYLAAADKSRAFAFLYKGRYMIYLGGTILLFDYNTKEFLNISSNLADGSGSIAWFKWDASHLIGELFGSLEFGDRTELLGWTPFERFDTTAGVRHRLIGNIDHVAYSDIDESYPISGAITVRPIDFGGNVHVRSVTVFTGADCEADSVSIEYVTDRGRAESVIRSICKAETDAVIRDMPGIRRMRQLGLTIRADKPFSVERIVIEYSEM